ncbi:MAG: hypothetical protein OXC30_00115 [Alphaproteobacteria bacterium]|nr:hypothetical protein [Alphaproteobacteria bacterium]
MFFKYFTYILIALLLVSCVKNSKNKPEAVVSTKHVVHPLNRAEIVMHTESNRGVPLVLQWVFVDGEKARKAVSALTASQFLQSEEALKREFPRSIRVRKHTMMPGETDILGFKVRPIEDHIFLYAHFLEKGVNRWVVLPRARVRVNIYSNTLKIQTREP